MIFSLERMVDPEIEPFGLAEAKRHLREFESVTSRDDDITALISAARDWLENYTGRTLIDQTWRLTVSDSENFGLLSGDSVSGYARGVLPVTLTGARELRLRRSPVIAIVSVSSVDSLGVETELDLADFSLVEEGTKWPKLISLNGVWTRGTHRVVFRSGFADRDVSPPEGEEAVPTLYKQAMKLWLSANYDVDPVDSKALIEIAERSIRSERCDLQLA